MNTL